MLDVVSATIHGDEVAVNAQFNRRAQPVLVETVVRPPYAPTALDISIIGKCNEYKHNIKAINDMMKEKTTQSLLLRKSLFTQPVNCIKKNIRVNIPKNEESLAFSIKYVNVGNALPKASYI